MIDEHLLTYYTTRIASLEAENKYLNDLARTCQYSIKKDPEVIISPGANRGHNLTLACTAHASLKDHGVHVVVKGAFKGGLGFFEYFIGLDDKLSDDVLACRLFDMHKLLIKDILRKAPWLK